MTLATGLTPQSATAYGGGFFNAMSSTDTDPAWVSLHGSGWAVGGGDIWGTICSAASDPNQSSNPGGMRLWRPGHGGAKSFACLGFTWSYFTAGRCYAYHGAGSPGGTANSGYLGYSDDYGQSWTEVSTGSAPANYQHAQPRAVGQTILARAVSGKDQIVAAAWDGIYSTQDVTTGSGSGFSKKGLDGLTCVGLARDPNNADIIYVAVRATVSGSLKPGLWKITLTSAGAASGATLLIPFSCQEVLAINEGGTTAIYAVGNGGVYRYKAGKSYTVTGTAPNGVVYCSVHGFAAGGTTTLAVGNMGNPGNQVLWTRFTSSSTAAPTWTALDTAARVPAYKVWGQYQAGDTGYWGFTGNTGGKAGAFAMAHGNTFVPSQIICLPNGGASADIYICGRTTIYALLDAADASQDWWICAKGTNGTQAECVAAAPGGGAHFSHGDFDFLISTTQTGYTGTQPRMHSPWVAYFFCNFYDEQGGVYFGGSPAGRWNNVIGGKVSYHPAPHDTSYSNSAGANGWMNWDAPGSKARVVGVMGFYATTNSRVLIACVYNDKTYRRVDTVTARDSNGNPKSWNIGSWSVLANIGVGLTGNRLRFARSATSAYILDPKRGLLRSDDNGVTFTVANASFAGSGQDMDNDPASPNTLIITKGTSVWLIADAHSAPGTVTQIGDANRFPRCGPVAFDRDSSQRTAGKSRLYVFNNAASGGNPALYYTDDYGSNWHAAGGPKLGSVVHTANDMAASNGYVVFASEHGSLTVAAPGSAPVDGTPPTPNPITNLQTVAAGITSLQLTCDAPSDPSGIDHVTWTIYTASSGGSPVKTVTTSDNNALVAGLTAATHYWGLVTATDGAATPNTTNPQAARVDLGSTAANPGSPPATPTLTVATPDPDIDTDTSVQLAVAGSDWDTAVINWGDPASSTTPLTYPATTASFDYGAYSDDSGFPSGYPISVVVTNSSGSCDPPAFASADLPDPNGQVNPSTFPLALIEDGMDVQIDLPIVFNQNVQLIQQYLLQLAGGGGGGGGGAEAEAWAVGGTPLTGTATTHLVPLPSGIVASTQAYCYLFVRSTTATITAPAGWTLRGTPATTNTGKLYMYEATLGSGDSSTTITWTASTATVMQAVIVGFTSVTGLDGTPVITGNGSTAITTHPTPAFGGPNTAATNEYVLSAVGARSSTGGITMTPPGGVTTYFVASSAQASGNDVAVIIWWTLQATVGAPPHLSANSSSGGFSVGSTAPLAHA